MIKASGSRKSGIAAGDRVVLGEGGTVRRATRYQIKVKRRRVIGTALKVSGDLVTVSMTMNGMVVEVAAS